MRDGGYAEPEFWLSDGWTSGHHRKNGRRPVTGVRSMACGTRCTLGGLRPVDEAAPVCHVSYYEADAFARWAGKCLPSEAEWESAARARRYCRCVRRGVAMDPQRLLALPRVHGPARRHRQIQRQVHGQSDGVARLLACDAGRPFPSRLSQFLPATRTLAVYRLAPRRTHGVSEKRSFSMNIFVRRLCRLRCRAISREVSAPMSSTGLSQLQETAAQIFLRCRRLAAVRRHHPVAGILSNAHGARHSAQQCCERLRRLMPRGAALIEFGAGSALKAKILLEAAPRIAAVRCPSISARNFWRTKRENSSVTFRALRYTPLPCADFTLQFTLPVAVRPRPRVGFSRARPSAISSRARQQRFCDKRARYSARALPLSSVRIALKTSTC